MKKINEPLSKNYLPVKLYIKDIYEIESLLKEFTSDIILESKGFQFSSVEEFSSQKIGQSITTLMIKTSNPYSYVDLDRLWTRIYVGSNDNTGSAFFFKLNEILKKGRRTLWFLYSYYLFWTFFLLQSIYNFLLPNSIKTSVGSYVIILISLWMFWVLFIRMRRHSLIIISPNSGIGNLWIRKKDDIILSIIAAIIGAILGIAGTLLINYLSNAN